jgi:hypothetical protein
MAANTSGQPGAIVPLEIQQMGWNWGAFLLHWIWAIAHSAWVGFVLAFFLNPIGAIYLGIKGNELAWQNRHWDSIEQFQETQKAWTKWGVIVLIASVAIWIVVMVLSAGAGMYAASHAH